MQQRRQLLSSGRWSTRVLTEPIALILFALLCIATCGCGRKVTVTFSNSASSSETTAEESLGDLADSSNADENDEGSETAKQEDPPEDEKPITLTADDLNAELARHKDESTFHFGPRPDGLPVGRWESVDADRLPLVFHEDGRFETGFLWRNGKGQVAKGLYAISDKGLVVAVAATGGIRLGVFYRLEDGKMYGSRGPSPKVEWRKVSDQTAPLKATSE